MICKRLRSQKGMATVEFTGVALVLMVVAFGIVEFGSLIQAQAVVTNVTREGGSLASRDLILIKKADPSENDLFDLLEASTWPLNFACPQEAIDNFTCNPTNQENRFRIYVAKINAGTSESPDPTCDVETSGELDGIGVESPANDPQGRCDLTQDLWNLLKYDDAYSTSPLTQLTVVKVYYRHDPLTPFVELLNVGPVFGGGSIYNFDSSEAKPEPPADPDNPPPPVTINLDSFLLSSTAIF